MYICIYIYIYIPDCFARCFFIIPSSSSISLSPFRFVRFFLAYVSISYASRRYTFSQVDVSLKFPTLFFFLPFSSSLRHTPSFSRVSVLFSLSLSSFIIYREIKEKKYIYIHIRARETQLYDYLQI